MARKKASRQVPVTFGRYRHQHDPSEMICAFTSSAFSRLRAFISSTARSTLIDKKKPDLQRAQSVNCQLPPEIWQEIFLFVHQSDDGLSVFDKENPIYIIGQVCQQWRHISHHCPRLWSRLCVSQPHFSNSVAHLRTVLERSCSAPLDFTFDGVRSSPDEKQELLSLLMEHSSRWRHAEFMGMTLVEALPLGNVRGQIPQLRSVRLYVYLNFVELESTDMVSAFEIAPELSHVDLRGISLGRVVLDPRAKLRYLRVEYNEAELMFSSTPPTFSDVLRAYPKLTTLTLQRLSYNSGVITWPAPPSPSTPRTVYTNLTSLSVAESGSINSLSLPNLTDLDAGSSFIQGIFPYVVSLLQHSQCRLSSLCLRYAEWDEDSMGVLLSLVLDLETLLISSGGTPGIKDKMSVLTRLLGEKSEDGRKPKYVTRLKTLCIELARDSRWTFTSPVFLDMVAMREKYGALEIVRLCGKSPRSEAFPHSCSDDLKRWKDMRRRGLIDVSLEEY